ESQMTVDLVHHFLGGEVLELGGEFLHDFLVILGEVLGGDDGWGVFGVGLELDDVEVAFAGSEEGAAAAADGRVGGIVGGGHSVSHERIFCGRSCEDYWPPYRQRQLLESFVRRRGNAFLFPRRKCGVPALQSFASWRPSRSSLGHSAPSPHLHPGAGKS